MKSIPRQVSASIWLRQLKRPFDAWLALTSLLLLSPLLLVTAALVKATSRGPVFFAQQRGGWNGAPFTAYKFRTMRGDRRPDPKEIVPLHHGDITPIGWFLRRFKIDELPQLWNVLRGDMSVVGPRPTLLDQVAAYDEFRRQRLLVRPGLTGLAQVNSSAEASWDERILYDIAYVRRCSFALDIAILSRTLLAVTAGERHTCRAFAKSPYAKYVELPPGFVPGT